MKYGYARCSTSEERQDINRQKRDLMALGVDDEKNIYWEYESGSKADRPEFSKLLDIVKPGDTILATEVSRLTRSTKQLCEVLDIVKERKLKLIIGSFVVDCTTEELDPMTKGMLMMWGVFSEMERDIIAHRVKSGIENARAKGTKLGRPQISLDDIPSYFWKNYTLHKQGLLNITELSKVTSLSRATVYKYIKLIENDGK